MCVSALSRKIKIKYYIRRLLVLTLTNKKLLNKAQQPSDQPADLVKSPPHERPRRCGGEVHGPFRRIADALAEVAQVLAVGLAALGVDHRDRGRDREAGGGADGGGGAGGHLDDAIGEADAGIGDGLPLRQAAAEE